MDGPTLETLARLARAGSAPGVELLVLMGSRATGRARPDSDWDFGYLGPVDPDELRLRLATELGTDDIDIADLARAGAVLRYQAAREGLTVIESRPGAFQEFWVAAVTFWCDVQPILQAEWDARLDALAR